MSEIERLRRRIDAVDERLVELLAERFGIAERIGSEKAQSGLQVFDPSRERRVVERAMALAGDRFPPERLQAIFREIISASRAGESGEAILVHGEPGSLAHSAAVGRFGSASPILTTERAEDLFARLADGGCAYAVVSLEGHSLEASLDRLDLFLHSDVSVFGEFHLRPALGLYEPPRRARAAAPAKPAKRGGPEAPVFGTAAALAQASRWIALQGTREVRAVHGVPEAIRLATEARGLVLGHAALETAFGLRPSLHGVEDLPEDSRRFVILARREAPATGHDKTTILLVLPNRSGALHGVTSALSECGLNLTWLEPKATHLGPWDHIFVLEIEGHRTEPRVETALRLLKERSDLMRVLGSYPVAARAERAE